MLEVPQWSWPKSLVCTWTEALWHGRWASGSRSEAQGVEARPVLHVALSPWGGRKCFLRIYWTIQKIYWAIQFSCLYLLLA